MCRDLNETVDGLMDEKVTLSNKLSAAQDALKSSQEASDSAQKRLIILEEELSQMTENIKQNQTDMEIVNKLNLEIASLKQDLESSQRQSLLAQEEISALEVENESLKSKINDLETQLDSLQVKLTEEPEVAVPASPTDLDSILNEYIDNETDIKKYILRYLEHYGVDVPVSVDPMYGKDNFFNVHIGDKSLSSKVSNGKFFVRVGGGWYTLKAYIENYVVKMKASKRNKEVNKVLVSTLYCHNPVRKHLTLWYRHKHFQRKERADLGQNQQF